MKEQIENLIKYIKTINVRGCITGSVMLECNENWNQDVDVFCYDEKSFTKLYYTLRLNPMFHILDKLEIWKANSFEQRDFNSSKHTGGVTTIKMMYNLTIPVNIILKKNCTNIFSVLSSFDQNIICKGFDLQTKQYLDLSDGSQLSKIANINKWNPAYSSTEIWQISRILRQLERCFKYHKRGYNTDAVVLKYIELIDQIQEYESVFNSENFNDKLEITQANTLIVKQICEIWLKTHEISEKELEILRLKIKEF